METENSATTNKIGKEKKVHGISVKQHVIGYMVNAGYSDVSDYVDYLLANQQKDVEKRIKDVEKTYKTELYAASALIDLLLEEFDITNDRLEELRAQAEIKPILEAQSKASE